MSADSSTPDLRSLIERLAFHEVRYVLNGSVAAMVYGVPLTPSDLDMAPELGADNLARAARLLLEIGAKPKFVPTWTKGPSREACENWKPEPLTVAQLDHRFTTQFGELDFVPSNAGTYEELAPRAINIAVFSTRLQVAHPSDILRYWRRWGRTKDEGRIRKLEEMRKGCGDRDIPPGAEERLSESP